MGGKSDIYNELFENELVKKIKKHTPFLTISGKVLSVDLEKLTCDITPADGGAEFFNIRLKANISSNDNGFIIIPKKGSNVLITMINNDENKCFVSQYGEIEKFHYKLHDLDFDLDANGYQIKKGDQNLKKVLNDLITEISKIRVINGTTVDVTKLTDIKNRLNQILK